ncbi:efflux RND transporter periplasmic adaptor subunit [Pseudoduganella umbonata]|uniref:Efflux RND transporter periplasmic adaptor subunit n=1 Tax=Pseudoduganella umbonata TaxID=864828 RepID=A0A4P8HVN4_9BURK|nr:efflux RND transporter periplasmic adaptor subunit [Pseudoduganella umbonata]MBB3225319.1 HlyD family secretion protein [Pseudoduganella umbonata]QCP12912.1 efflux RND transporter periplasmic adaptor subunit [Pseudoduganella umbonata]
MIRDTSHQDTVIATPRQRPWQRHALLAAGAAALLAAAVFTFGNWAGSEHSVSAARLRIAEVTRGTLIRDAAVNGRIVAAVSPTLYSTAPSSTVTLKARAGDTVKQGDVLAVLESPDLTDELKKEQSTYQELAAEVARQQILARKQKLLAQRDADTAEIDRLSAQRTLERYDGVANEGVVAKIDYQKAKDALRAAEIRARHAIEASTLEKDDVDLALRTKSAQLERQKLVLANAQRRVDELTVRAPVDGFIGTLSVANRSVVQANTPLMTLVDLSALEVELEVPETYVNDLGLGMRAEITVNGATTVGKLSALSPEVVKNQVLARVRFEGRQPEGLRQSQRVQARLLIDEKANVLLLPRGPFVESEGGRYAYLVQDGVAVRTPIRMGATSINAVEILSGLKQGDKVVVAGTETFENAKSVAINH